MSECLDDDDYEKSNSWMGHQQECRETVGGRGRGREKEAQADSTQESATNEA